MRWIRFNHNGNIAYGILSKNSVKPVTGTPFGSYTVDTETLQLRDVELLTPVMPGTFYAVGYNYIAHIDEAKTFLKKPPETPKKPDVGYRSIGALIGHDQPIIIPQSSPGIIQFEGELVAVIGKMAKHVRKEDALDYVLGFTIGNDISERSWQSADRTIWRAKNTDTFKPMGPWIETEVHLPDLFTQVRLNGTKVSEFKTDNMIFGVEDYIAEITKAITMYPGDVLWMGAQAPTLDMKAGDVVEVEITGIGTLRNPIIAERASPGML